PPSPARTRPEPRDVLRAPSASGAEARHRPRRLRLLRAPLRPRRRPRRHPVADDAGPALPRGQAPAPGADPPRDPGWRRPGELEPNGGGKSTLFRVLLGELRPLRGSFRRPRRLGFVPQTERSRLDYPVSALDVALMGTLSRLPWWRPVGRSDRRAALDALERVGLAELADEQFGELSGGQREGVLVAGELVQDAPVLLVDETFFGFVETDRAL